MATPRRSSHPPKPHEEDECDRCAEVFQHRHLIHLIAPADLFVCQACLADIKDEGQPFRYALQA